MSGPPHLWGIRWVYVFVFPLGVGLTNSEWGKSFGSVFLVSLIGSLCFGLFLLQVREISARTLMPVLVATVLIIAYPVKTCFIAWASGDLANLGDLALIARYTHALSLATLTEGYITGMLGLGVFFLTSSLLLAFTPQRPRAINWTDQIDRRRLIRILWTLFVVSNVIAAVLNLIAFELGLLRFGVEARVLPYRLTGIISYSRTFFGSILQLLIFYFALSVHARWLLRVSVAGMLLNSLLFAAVTASRGALVLWIVVPVFIMIITGQLNVGRLMRLRALPVVVGVLCFSILSHTLVSFYREGLADTTMSSVSAMQYAVGSTIESLQDNPVGMLLTSTGMILVRFVGAEQLMLVKEIQASPRPEQAWNAVVSRSKPVALYYTREVLGIDTFDFQISPGLLGFFWQFGGLPVIMVGMMLFTFILFGLNGIYGFGVRLVASPVTLAVFASTAAIATSEGTLLQVFGPEPFVLSMIVLALTEITARMVIAWAARHGYVKISGHQTRIRGGASNS